MTVGNQSIVFTSQEDAMETVETFVDCENHVSWAGEYFSYLPGEIISLPESVAKARQEAGLLAIVATPAIVQEGA